MRYKSTQGFISATLIWPKVLFYTNTNERRKHQQKRPIGILHVELAESFSDGHRQISTGVTQGSIFPTTLREKYDASSPESCASSSTTSGDSSPIKQAQSQRTLAGRLMDSDGDSVSDIPETFGTSFDLDVDNLTANLESASIQNVLENKVGELLSVLEAKTKDTERWQAKFQGEMSKLTSTQYYQLNAIQSLRGTLNNLREKFSQNTTVLESVVGRIEQVDGNIVSQIDSLKNTLDQTVDVGEVDRLLNDGELLSFVILLYGSCDTH